MTTAVPKALLNRLTVEGVNALLDDAVRAALLERMAELPLDDPRADIIVEPTAAEVAALAAAPVVRANVGPKTTPSTRMQALVNLSQRVGYGPLNRPEYVVDASDPDGNGCDGDIAIGGPWYGNQRPMRGATKPDGAWACSTAVNALVSAWLNAGALFRRAGGAKIEKQLQLSSQQGGFREYVAPLHDGRPTTWEHMLAHHCGERGSVNVALISFQNKQTGKWRAASHVVLILDCDRLDLVDPATGGRCRGLWRFGADGSFDDVPDTDAVAARQPGAYRAYSCRRTTFRPVAANDNGRAYLHRVIELRPDGLTPWVAGGAYHLNNVCGLRLRLAS